MAVSRAPSTSLAARPGTDQSVSDGAVGATGQPVSTSPVIQSLAQQPDGSMELRALGAPSQAYLIQACEKLGAWATISTKEKEH